VQFERQISGLKALPADIIKKPCFGIQYITGVSGDGRRTIVEARVPEKPCLKKGFHRGLKNLRYTM
jgi:hypothetical protein